MTESVKVVRKYSSTLRTEQAAATRKQILDAAWSLFTTAGYGATTVGRIAADADVSVDTLYATIGRKPAILREVVEAAISGTGQTVPADERDYVQRVREAATAQEKIRLYVDAIVAMSPRTSPIFAALRDAARTDRDCAALDAEISTRRADNMALFASDLRAAGGVRSDLDDRQLGDIIWATAGFEHYRQFVDGRGWTPRRFGDYLTDLWERALLSS